MMDKEKILENGILEQYLLGTLSEAEAAMVEKLLQEDAALFEQYTKLENDLETLAFENAIAPPTEVKSKLLKEVVSKKGAKSKVEEKPNKSKISFFAVAASFAGLFLLSTVFFFTHWNTAKADLVDTQNELDALKNRIEVLESNYNKAAGLVDFIKEPNTKQLVLIGNEKVANVNTISYINHTSKEVLVNATNLPKLPDTKTYQVWGDVDGEMINMGLLEAGKDLVALNYIDKATSINITIEPAGGSDHATVSQLVANVYL